MRFDGSNNDYRLSRNDAPKILPESTLKEVEKRQKYAVLLSSRDKIEEYQKEVFGIVENDGLYNENEKIRLETALKVIEYIVPKKKSSELTVITRKIEDLICESIEEAEIIEDKGNVKDE